jgi:hypothetical protein
MGRYGEDGYWEDMTGTTKCHSEQQLHIAGCFQNRRPEYNYVFFSPWLNSRLIVRVCITHTISRTPLNQRSARRRDRYQHNAQQTQETNLHALRATPTRYTSYVAATDLRLRPRGRWELRNLYVVYFLSRFH